MNRFAPDVSASLSLVLLICLAGVGCASPVPNDGLAGDFKPLVDALTQPAARLKQAAAAGDPFAQLSYSYALEFGLNEEPVDLREAHLWRAEALRQRGSTFVTQYFAGFEGRPSSVSLVPVPQYGIRGRQADLISSCIDDLRSDRRVLRCGEQRQAERLRQAWSAAAAQTESNYDE